MTKESSLKNMMLCLGAITFVCGALLACVYILTEEPIADAAKARTEAAISAVSPQFASLEEISEPDGTPMYVARDADNGIVSLVVNASSSGFGGKLSLMVGFLPDSTIFNTAVLGHSETPGLGAKCTESVFADQFKGFNPSVSRLKVRKDGGDVDAITASTITSRAYCTALQNAVDKFNRYYGQMAEAGEGNDNE